DIGQGLAKASQSAGVTVRKEGDPESALTGAAKMITAVYEAPFLAHAAMEPMNCTVHVRKDSCEVWTGSQVLSRARAAAAEVTGFHWKRSSPTTISWAVASGAGSKSTTSPRRCVSPSRWMHRSRSSGPA